MAQAKQSQEDSTERKPASSTEIMQSLAPYLSQGPAGLAVRIGTKEITLRREQRKFAAPRNTDLDTLIEAAVDMSGPLTPDEVAAIFKPYESKSVQMKIEGDTIHLTRKAHVESFAAHDGKIKNVGMRERTVSSSLDVPMAHLINVLNDLTKGAEMFE